MTLFAGIDAGTGGARCLITDERGARVAYAERPWAYVTDETGFPTLPPEAALRAVEEAVAETLDACDATRIRAAGVTSQRTGVVLMDADDAPLVVSPNADGRAVQEGIALERAHGPLVYRIAGRLPVMLYLPARLAWARANRPGWTIARALSLSDWIVHALTGVAATEPTQAAEMLVYDVAAGDWSDELLRALDVPRSILPSLLPSGEPAGEARALFAQGTPVVPAGADTQCAALAMGCIRPGDGYVVAGTTMLAGGVRDVPVPDEAGRLWISPMQAAARWVHEAHCGEAGALVAWVADLLGSAPAGLAEEAARGQPGSGGVVVVDPFPSTATNFTLIKRGVLTFPAPVIALGRPRADVARAVLEGIAFGARAGLDLLGDLASLSAAGGVTRSEAFARALAGSSERAVTVATEPASSALGAAIVAAARHHGGVEAAVGAMADAGREVAPVASDGYPAHYALWRERAEDAARGAMRIGDIV